MIYFNYRHLAKCFNCHRKWDNNNMNTVLCAGEVSVCSQVRGHCSWDETWLSEEFFIEKCCSEISPQYLMILHIICLNYLSSNTHDHYEIILDSDPFLLSSGAAKLHSSHMTSSFYLRLALISSNFFIVTTFSLDLHFWQMILWLFPINLVLQLGHTGFFSDHKLMQLMWNWWPQAVRTGVSGIRQILQELFSSEWVYLFFHEFALKIFGKIEFANKLWLPKRLRLFYEGAWYLGPSGSATICYLARLY